MSSASAGSKFFAIIAARISSLSLSVSLPFLFFLSQGALRTEIPLPAQLFLVSRSFRSRFEIRPLLAGARLCSRNRLRIAFVDRNADITWPVSCQCNYVSDIRSVIMITSSSPDNLGNHLMNLLCIGRLARDAPREGGSNSIFPSAAAVFSRLSLVPPR